MMEHTPGPWEEKITDDGHVWVLMPDAHRVSIGDMEETCGICHANARLIAAAPDLLEQFQDALKGIDEQMESDDFYAPSVKILRYKAWKAAIARAAPLDDVKNGIQEHE